MAKFPVDAPIRKVVKAMAKSMAIENNKLHEMKMPI